MSFILDALRKAEDKNRDRHNMTVPTGPRVVTEDLPEAPPAEGFPVAVWIVLGILFAAVVWWLLQDSPTEPQTVSATPAQATQSAPLAEVAQTPPRKTAAPAERPVTPRETGTRALDREAQRGAPERRTVASATGDTTPADTPAETQTRQSVSPVKPGTVQILNADGTAPTGVTPGRVDQETLPEYRTSLTSGDVPIPELHLDMHVYSAEPEKRFVFINLEKYGEGDAITKDTTIESIEPKGAVINHKGYRFVLLPD